MDNEYKCPLVNSNIDETICYDIQMTVGPGNLINKRILEDYADIFNIDLITDERPPVTCPNCVFNQLGQLSTNQAISA